MKRKLCLCLAMLLLILPMTVFFVQGETADATQWAVVNYLYDPDEPEQEAKGGTLSFAKSAKNYMRRYTTLTWDAQTLDVKVTYKNNNQEHPCQQGSCRITQAGDYTVTVKNLANGESVSCLLTMLPVVKMSGQYLSSNSTTGEFWTMAFNYFPVVECENVDRMQLDTKLGSENANDNFMSGMQIDTFGRHSLTFISGAYAITAYFDVHACVAEKIFDEELGKHCLLLSVGNFGEDTAIYLDNQAQPLAAGEHKITGVGQHTITAKKGDRTLKNASPAAQQLNLQVQLLMDSLELEEPMTLRLSRWDAVFYVNGRKIEGDYRVANGGKTTVTAFDQNGKQIENAFIVQESASNSGEVYTELVLNFQNPHYIYAIFLILPALAMSVAVWIFWRRRRRIV